VYSEPCPQFHNAADKGSHGSQPHHQIQSKDDVREPRGDENIINYIIHERKSMKKIAVGVYKK
jgi:hypothetical protein